MVGYHSVNVKEVELPVKKGVFGKKIRAKVHLLEIIPEQGTLTEKEGKLLLEFLEKKGS